MAIGHDIIWRKGLTEESGFEFSYMLNICPVGQTPAACGSIRSMLDPSTMSACMPSCPAMMIMD